MTGLFSRAFGWNPTSRFSLGSIRGSRVPVGGPPTGLLRTTARGADCLGMRVCASLFQAQADWLKTHKTFDAVLKEIIIKGKKYENVAFNFPRGN